MDLMHKDKRSKGCPNEKCRRNSKNFFYKAEDNFCVECGSKLVYVCRECFGPLASDDPSAILCARCQSEKEDQRDKVLKMGAAVAGGAAVVKAFVPAVIKSAKDIAGRVIKA